MKALVHDQQIHPDRHPRPYAIGERWTVSKVPAPRLQDRFAKDVILDPLGVMHTFIEVDPRTDRGPTTDPPTPSRVDVRRHFVPEPSCK